MKTSVSPCLRAQRLDVRAGQLVLGHDELLQLDLLAELHAPGVDAEDVALGVAAQFEFESNS